MALSIDTVTHLVYDADRLWLSVIDHIDQQPPWATAGVGLKQLHKWLVQTFWEFDPVPGPAEAHAIWFTMFTDAGWTHGPIIDGAAKEHPWVQPHQDLSDDEKKQQNIYTSILNSMRDGWTDQELEDLVNTGIL